MRRRRRSVTKSGFGYAKSDFVEKELVDKITLWALRIIFKLGGSKEFLDQYNRFESNSLAYFLDAGQFVEMDDDEFRRSEVFDILKKNFAKLERRKRFTTSKILAKNIAQLSKLMDLTQILQ